MSTHVVRTVSGRVHFAPYNREKLLLFTDENSSKIVDVRLQFFAAPTTRPLTDAQLFTGVEDIRLYVGGYDVTLALVAELQAEVQTIPEADLRTRYLDASSAYLRHIRSFGVRDHEVQNDDTVAQNIAASGNWGTKFAVLGDRPSDGTWGWSGNLHPVNFMGAMGVPPISISNVWARYHASNPEVPRTLRELATLAILISSGAAPAYSTIDPAFIPSGCVAYQLDLVNENPLKASLKQIISRLRTLQRSVEQLRVNYLDPFESEIQNVETELENGSVAIAESIDRLETTVGNIAGP